MRRASVAQHGPPLAAGRRRVAVRVTQLRVPTEPLGSPSLEIVKRWLDAALLERGGGGGGWRS